MAEEQKRSPGRTIGRALPWDSVSVQQRDAQLHPKQKTLMQVRGPHTGAPLCAFLMVSSIADARNNGIHMPAHDLYDDCGIGLDAA
jgi:hypothetical protein